MQASKNQNKYFQFTYSPFLPDIVGKIHHYNFCIMLTSHTFHLLVPVLEIPKGSLVYPLHVHDEGEHDEEKGKGTFLKT